MPMVLGPNQYGKAQTRLVRVRRDADRHEVKDLNVSVALSGDLDDAHLTGANTAVLPTDSVKNTVYAFAQRHGVSSAEEFGVLLARHFVESQPAIRRARVRIEEYAWNRITERHSFVRDGGETRTAEVVYEGAEFAITAGLAGLVVMNTTDSEFRGFVHDPYTTLEETNDRILATEVNARWRFSRPCDERTPVAFDYSYAQVRQHLLDAFADTYSRSLQQTLFAMGNRVLENRPEIDEIRLSLPNKHHFLVDLAPFGLKNDNEVYYAADRPYGLIEGTVHRDGVVPSLAAD